MVNPHLAKYQNIHLGETCIIFGIGRTLFEYPGGFDCIKIGAGDIVYYEKEQMDYYFMCDSGHKLSGYNSSPDKYEAG